MKDPQLQRPLAVIFTSFSNRTDKLFVYTNTIRNWASFLPHIQPVLFTTFADGPVIKEAKSNGWRVYPKPAVNMYGLPILKYMYKDVPYVKEDKRSFFLVEDIAVKQNK